MQSIQSLTLEVKVHIIYSNLSFHIMFFYLIIINLSTVNIRFWLSLFLSCILPVL